MSNMVKIHLAAEFMTVCQMTLIIIIVCSVIAAIGSILAMSKEREAFEATNPAFGVKRKKDGSYSDRHTEKAYHDFCRGYQAATAHYQPLLEAKDAEIALNQEARTALYEDLLSLRKENTSLKVLLEQAREALKELSFSAQTSGGVAGRDEGLCNAIVKAKASIAAINAATGEK